MRQQRAGSRRLGRGVLLVTVLGGTLACSSAKSPEDFCDGWVESTCTAVSACCGSGSSFDPEACRVELWSACLDKLPVEQVHSGEVVFDSHAAGDCAGEIRSCADLTASQTTATYEREKACGTMLTGFRPLGAACSESAECEKHGDFAQCYYGNAGGSGICVKPHLSDSNTCGFSFATMELTLCPDGTFCDTSAVEPNPASPPSVQEYEFSASCKAYLGAGESCTSTTGTLRCGTGLYCSYADGVCTAYATQGQSCATGEQCGPGLDCVGSASGETCETGNSAPYCYHPPVCGDGVCDTGESQTCPQDCGACGVTGDYCVQPGDCCSDYCNTMTSQCG